MTIPFWIPSPLLQVLSAAGLWISFAAGLGWAFVGYFLHRERLAALSGGISCIAALIASLCANELANRSNDIVLSVISARTLHNDDLALLNKILPTTSIVVNVQYEGDEPSHRNLHLDEEESFKFSIENAFRATDAAKAGRLQVGYYDIPTLGFRYGVDLVIYVPHHKTDLQGTLEDPIVKAFMKMGFTVNPTNRAFDDWPDKIVETTNYDGSAYPDHYIIAVNSKPPARLRGRPFWGPNIAN